MSKREKYFLNCIQHPLTQTTIVHLLQEMKLEKAAATFGSVCKLDSF